MYVGGRAQAPISASEYALNASCFCVDSLCTPYVVSALFAVAWVVSFSPESGQTSHPYTRSGSAGPRPTPLYAVFCRHTTNHGRLMPAKHPEEHQMSDLSLVKCVQP